MMKRRQIDRALAGLEVLEALGAELGASRTPPARDGVIELVEVRPGVFAAPSRPMRAANQPSFAARMRDALRAAEDVAARMKEKPWK